MRHTEGIAVVGHFLFFTPFLLLILVLKMLFDLFVNYFVFYACTVL